MLFNNNKQCDVHLYGVPLRLRERVVVDGAASEWIPIISGVPHGGVLGPLLYILYTSEIFELVENRLFA